MRLFTRPYRLNPGTHKINVRGGTDQVFQLKCIVFPEGGSKDDADAADRAFDAFLDGVKSGGDITQIASDAFLENHVLTKKVPDFDGFSFNDMNATICSVMRGKATSVIVVDAATSKALCNEVIEKTKREEYSSSGLYTSSTICRTYNLDPQTGKFQIYDAAFDYSVYHEEKDGLWRISHYQGVASGGKLLKEWTAPKVVRTASDHTQSPEHKDAEKETKEDLTAAQSKLQELEKNLKDGTKGIEEADKRIAKFQETTKRLKEAVSDYDGFLKKHREENPVLEEEKAAAKAAELEKRVEAANKLREAQVREVSRLTSALRSHGSDPSPKPNEGEAPKVTKEMLEQANKERTRLADDAGKLKKEHEFWKNVVRNYKRYCEENAPPSHEELSEQLSRQETALKEALAARQAASTKQKDALEGLAAEGDGLRKSIAELSVKAADRPNRHKDWIEKLRKLSDAASAEAIKEHTTYSEPLPPV